ncbi:MAG: hypothetical protein KatS3mg098_490 [Candidatus Parcubacteria bacterium]|nr:MAG: hypothetical protein KatS3mg098_490 [Candidatus Parcubacteria bacterium]
MERNIKDRLTKFYNFKNKISFLIKLIKKEKAFTLYELIIVISLIAILATIGIVNFSSYKSKRNFDLDVEKVVESIRNTQQRSISQENKSSWSIRFTNSTSTDDYFEIFPDPSYSTSSVVLRGSLSYASELTNPAPGFSKTISFSAISGKPTAAQVVSLKQKNKDNVYSIFISSSGQIRSLQESGLVGYWPMDESSGSYAYDASGYSKDGLLSVGASGTQTTTSQAWNNGLSGRVGGALNFDGTDDYLNISSINPNNAITVSAWVKSNLTTGYSGVYQIVSKYSAYILGTNASGGKNMCFIIYTTTWQYNPCYTVNDPQNWHHFVGTYDSLTGERKIYVDGSFQGLATSTGSIYNDTGSIHIAHREGSAVGTDHFNGLVDEVRIYSRALSEDEIKKLYESY